MVACARGRQVQRRLQRAHRLRHALPVGLVHDDDVGNFKDAGFHRLHVVACPRRLDDDHRLRDARHIDFQLACADGLDQDDVIAASIQRRHHVRRGTGDAAERAPTGHAANEHAGVAEKIAHAEAIPQDRPTAEGAAGVDCHHRHLGRVRAGAQNTAQLRDQGALAGTRRAGDADHACAPGMHI